MRLKCTRCGALCSEFNPECKHCGEPLPSFSAELPHASGKGVGGTIAPTSNGAPNRGSVSPVGLRKRLGEYEVLSELGRGAMGAVVLARDTLLERDVAIKLLIEDLTGESNRAGFLREARALARVRHQNVVSIYRVGEIDGEPFIVTELIRGPSLKELKKPIGWRRAVEIGVQVARGLSAAHARGVLHRDLKPGNVVLGADGAAKIVDFGLARVNPERERSGDHLTTAASASGATDSEYTVGTPMYMPPETLLGGAATEAGDIYGVGGILYELIAGVAPRETISRDLPLRAFVQEAPVALADLDGCDVPRSVSDIVARSLALDPKDRFGSAADLAASLEGLLAADGPADVPDGNPYCGLRAFDAAHRAVFFGREVEVSGIARRLLREQMLVIVGDSGIGKSSTCKAGVLVKLANQSDEHKGARIASFAPGPVPVDALEDALANVVKIDFARALRSLEEDSSALYRAIEPTLDDDENLIVFVDQLEEVEALTAPGDVEQFLTVLAACTGPRVHCLATARSDYVGKLLALPRLGGVFSRALYFMRPMGADGLRAAIVRPALLKGVRFEFDEVVDELVAMAGEGAGSLPLLSFAMHRFWEHQQPSAGDCLSRAQVQAIGQVGAVLGRYADDFLAAKPIAVRTAARHVLLRLIRSDGVPLPIDEEFATLGRPERLEALRELVRARLVVARVTRNSVLYEIAHQALIDGWSTLRGWLASAAATRAAVDRLESAVTEWLRQQRSVEALWTKKQISELERSCGEEDLSPAAREFVEESRRNNRARARMTWFKAAALAISAVVLVAMVWARATRALDESVNAHLNRGAERFRVGADSAAKACSARDEAYAAYDKLHADTPGELSVALAQAEELWRDALEVRAEADAALAIAAGEADAAMALDPKSVRARALASDAVFARLSLAEEFHLADLASDLSHGLRSRSVGQQPSPREAPSLEIRVEPADALVRLEGRPSVGDHDAQESASLAAAPGMNPLPGAGLYLLSLSAPGRRSARYPFLAGRGERVVAEVKLPLATHVPEGFVWVPAGPFFVGALDYQGLRKGLLNAAPLHQVKTRSFIIAKHEVTFGDWMSFLRALPASDRRRLLPNAESQQGTVRLSEIAGDRFSLEIGPAGVKPSVAAEGEPIVNMARSRRVSRVWERLPVAGVSALDVAEYLSWLDKTSAVPGARFCTELEWERAARGADGRLFPNGDWVEADDANFDETYGRVPEAFGLDEVGSHPRSQSVFEIDDLFGNVYEWAKSTRLRDEWLIRGGAYYYDRPTGWIPNRTISTPSTRDVTVGARVCADDY